MTNVKPIFEEGLSE